MSMDIQIAFINPSILFCTQKHSGRTKEVIINFFFPLALSVLLQALRAGECIEGLITKKVNFLQKEARPENQFHPLQQIQQILLFEYFSLP